MNRHTFIATAALAATLALAGCSPEAPADPGADPSASAPVDVAPAALDDRPLDDQLADAVRDGNVALVGLALDAGADPDADLGSGARPLHIVAATGDAEVASALVAAGADLEDRASDGYTPLMRAASKNQAEVASILVGAGADPYALAEDLIGGNALHIAAQWGATETVSTLLVTGMDANTINPNYGSTPLHAAAFWGNVDALDVLLSFGGDPTIAADNGRDVYATAAYERQQAVIDYLESVGITG